MIRTQDYNLDGQLLIGCCRYTVCFVCMYGTPFSVSGSGSVSKLPKWKKIHLHKKVFMKDFHATREVPAFQNIILLEEQF